jgi:protein PhnA
MPNPACPACTLEETLSHPGHWECGVCGHEWPKEEVPEAARVVKDAHGNVLVAGDTVALIKDLKLGSGSQVLKAGTKRRTSASSTATTRSTARSRACPSR